MRCLVIIATFTLLLFVRSTEAYPHVAHTQEDKAIWKDLQELTLAYERCRIHVVLFNGKLKVPEIRSPYTLSRIEVNYPYYGSARNMGK